MIINNLFNCLQYDGYLARYKGRKRKGRDNCRLIVQQKFQINWVNGENRNQFFIKMETHQENYRKKHRILMASALSSVVSTCITNPIEVAKLRIQYYPVACTHNLNLQSLAATCGCAKVSWSGSFKSLKVAVPQVLLSNILYAELYENTRAFLKGTLKLDSAESTLVASMASRFFVTTVNVPLQSTRIKISNNIKRKSLIPGFHGYKVTLARDMIYSAMFWSMLEAFRNTAIGGEYRDNINKDSNFTMKNFTMNLFPAFILGGFVSAVTTPLDTLKTRIQSKQISNYSIIKGIREIYRNQGMKGLFSSVKLRMMKNSLHTSLYLFMYEWHLKQVSPLDALTAALEEEL